jgi:hypothetical protein
MHDCSCCDFGGLARGEGLMQSTLVTSERFKVWDSEWGRSGGLELALVHFLGHARSLLVPPHSTVLWRCHIVASPLASNSRRSLAGAFSLPMHELRVCGPLQTWQQVSPREWVSCVFPSEGRLFSVKCDPLSTLARTLCCTPVHACNGSLLGCDRCAYCAIVSV